MPPNDNRRPGGLSTGGQPLNTSPANGLRPSTSSGNPLGGNSGSGDWDRKRDRKFNDKRDEKPDGGRYEKPRENHHSGGSNPSAGSYSSERARGVGGSEGMRLGASTSASSAQNNTVNARDLGTPGLQQQ